MKRYLPFLIFLLPSYALALPGVVVTNEPDLTLSALIESDKQPQSTSTTTKAAPNVDMVNGEPSPNAGKVNQVQNSNDMIEPLDFMSATSFAEQVDSELPWWLKLKTSHSARHQILPDGSMRFTVVRGSFVDNLKVALSLVHKAKLEFHEDSFPRGLRFPNTFDIVVPEADMLLVIDKMLKPFYHQHNVIGLVHENQIYELTIGVVQ